MIEHRSFNSLGHADHGWLDARHHFSFAEYHDPEGVNWGALRVWNDPTRRQGDSRPRESFVGAASFAGVCLAIR